MNTILISNGTYYHQTRKSAVRSILQDGFIVEKGFLGHRFTDGIYFLEEPTGDFGEVTLECKITGYFINLSNDRLGHAWRRLKKMYIAPKHTNNIYTNLTINLQRKFRKADGIIFPNMLVVWHPEKCVKSIKIHGKEEKLSSPPKVVERDMYGMKVKGLAPTEGDVYTGTGIAMYATGVMPIAYGIKEGKVLTPEELAREHEKTTKEHVEEQGSWMKKK